MSDADLTELTLTEARDRLKARDFTAREITDAYLAAIEGATALNAYILPTPDEAREMAAQADARLARGEARPLEGLPIAVKDLFCTRHIRTTAGSRILGNFVPPYESTVTDNLWKAGAVCLGKANLDEFAMGSSNETSAFGPAINPWRRRSDGRTNGPEAPAGAGGTVDGAPHDDEALVPGGSSGGSAVAVAAGLCAAAIGTDTGGSIRQPAALTATVGLKPTYGRCSRWGIVAFASSLDQAGPITRTVRDAAAMLRVMASIDEKDTTSVDWPVDDYEAALGASVKGKRIGIPAEYRVADMPEALERLWDDGKRMLKDAGAEIVDISLPHTKYALPAYYIVAPAEASSNLARYDGVRYGVRVPRDEIVEMYEATRAAGFGAEVQRRVLIGTYVLSAGYYDAYYLRAPPRCSGAC